MRMHEGEGESASVPERDHRRLIGVGVSWRREWSPAQLDRTLICHGHLDLGRT